MIGKLFDLRSLLLVTGKVWAPPHLVVASYRLFFITGPDLVFVTGIVLVGFFPLGAGSSWVLGNIGVVGMGRLAVGAPGPVPLL